MTTLLANIRHDLDPALVQASIEKQVENHERFRDRLKSETQQNLEKFEKDAAAGMGYLWARKPDPTYIDPMIDSWIARERNEYALVRVIELPQPGKRFMLVYGNADDTTVVKGDGTGPFESLERAAGWFYGQGR